MTAVYSAEWFTPTTGRHIGVSAIRVVLDNPAGGPGRPTSDPLRDVNIAKGAASIKLDVDTEDLAVLTIVECDGDAGRRPRPRDDTSSRPPTSRIILLAWDLTPVQRKTWAD